MQTFVALVGCVYLAVSIVLPVLIGRKTAWNLILAIVAARAALFVMGLTYYWLAAAAGLVPTDCPGGVPGCGWVSTIILVAVWRPQRDSAQKRAAKATAATFEADQLAAVGVDIVDRESRWLRCRKCGGTWSVLKQADGRLPEGFWRRKNGCNATR
jgi:hypothetical protein